MGDKSTGVFLPIEGQGAKPILGRIAHLYGCKTKADLGRVLGMSLKSIWAAIERESVPYPQIVDKCPPSDWEFIFTGRRPPERSEGPITFDAAMEYLASLGWRVTLEKKG
jgi:hypothetical protein